MSNGSGEYSYLSLQSQHQHSAGGENGEMFGGSGGVPNGGGGGDGSAGAERTSVNGNGSDESFPIRGRGGSRTVSANSAARGASTESDETNETLGSTTEVASNQSIDPPAPPVNSPQSTSVADATEQLRVVNLTEADERLQGMASGGTPPGSNAGDATQGKAHLRGRLRADLPLLKQLFKTAPPKATKKKRKMTRAAGPVVANTEDPTHLHHPEHSTWLVMAMEDTECALKRMAMAASDEHKNHPEKSVEEHYCENLAKVLKAGEIKFDPKHLE